MIPDNEFQFNFRGAEMIEFVFYSRKAISRIVLCAFTQPKGVQSIFSKEMES